MDTDIFHFDKDTGAYLGTSKATPHPLHPDLAVKPANATFEAPPDAGANKIPVWSEDAWTVEHDFRSAELWMPDGEKVDITEIGVVPPENALTEEPPAPEPDLEDMKALALVEARLTASKVRQEIAGAANTKRAVGWMLKAMFASVWQVNEQAPNPLLQPLADLAAQGFELETNLTGENPTDVRDRAIAKSGVFFLALQLVEGMERMAEDGITAVTSKASLTELITQLRDMEDQARNRLQSLDAGASDAQT